MHRSLAAAVLLLSTACSPKASPSVATYQLTPTLVIGGAEDGPSSFADIRWFAVDHRFRLYVLESQSQEVRVFDSTGTYLQSLGRRGAGPGEFTGANGIAVGPGDELWVYDPGNSRATVFDSVGRLARTIPLQLSGYGFIWAGGVDSLGTLYDPIDVPRGKETRKAVRRLSTSGITDTVLLPTCTGYTPPTYRFPRGGMWVPYTAPMYEDLDPRGYAWCADSRRVEVRQFRLGDTLPQHTFAAVTEPSRVSAQERAAAIADVEKFAKETGGSAPDFSLIPEVKPVLHRVDTDDSGHVWVQIEDQQGFQALIFDSLGTLVAHVSLPFRPARWQPTIVIGRSVYAVTRDSLDVPTITRFQYQRR